MIGGTTFTTTSSASFVSAEKNGLSCSVSGGAANYIQTTSSVRWTGLLAARPAVTQSSIISTLVTGLLVKVKDQNEEPVEGATVTLSGADTGSQTTPASGCVSFVGLTAGSVTVSVSKSSCVEVNGKTPATKSATVVNEKIATSELQIAEPGAIKAEFESNGKTGVSGESFVAYQSGIAEPSFFDGTASKPETSITTPATSLPIREKQSSGTIHRLRGRLHGEQPRNRHCRRSQTARGQSGTRHNDDNERTVGTPRSQTQGLGRHERRKKK